MELSFAIFLAFSSSYDTLKTTLPSRRHFGIQVARLCRKADLNRKGLETSQRDNQLLTDNEARSASLLK